MRVPAIVPLLALVSLGRAQVSPHIGYVYPAGGRQGTTFEVTVGGQFLDGVSEALISGIGIQAEVVRFTKPMTPQQVNKLREQLQELMAKRPRTAEDEKTLAELRQKIAVFLRRPATPAVAETVALKISTTRDLPPGERELRLLTPAGLTNPLILSIGQLPEFSKPLSQAAVELPVFRPAAIQRRAPGPPAEITLPAILNGQIMPGGVDRYRFHAAKGLQLVVAASARELIPYISDAVPGWFQATLALYDARGKEVDYADHYLFHPDPLLHYAVPEDGEYTLEVRDSIYRGRDDFVYRIAVGELPVIGSIFPLGARAGAKTAVELKGWNLPVAKLTRKSKDAGVHPISVRRGEWVSNRVPFAVDTLPERLEKEPNNDVRKAQKIKPPVIVNGRIDRPGDWDVFRFDGRAGDEIVAEVFARRLDSPLDSVLKLTDAAGKELAANDDYEDQGAGLITHQADSRIGIALPRKGVYYLRLGDAQHRGGAEFAYRLRVSRPRPDFELRLVPSSINVRAGATVPITVYALRRDGFAGEIALALKEAPPGFALSGGWLPADVDQVRLTLTAVPAREPVALRLEGTAVIQSKQVRHAAVPAEDMMQAFAYHHLVPAKECLVRVIGSGPARPQWKLAEDKPVRLAAGGTAPVRVLLPFRRPVNQLHLALNEPPEGVAIQGVSPARDGLSILLRADAKVKPGLKGNLIVDAFLERPAAKKANPRANRRAPLGTLPAIPFEIVSGALR